METFSCRNFLVSQLAIVAALVGSAAHAQAVPAPSAAPATPAGASNPSAGSAVEEIVVTAQRRSENLQKVPIAVAVATAAQLSNSGISNVQNLKMIAPGVEVQSNNGYALPIIRGVGSKGTGAGFESPIAFYVDGVYYANATANILTFNNVAQVEILKGPQGTLFGRNATGGLIQVTTRDPKNTFGVEADASYGNYKTFKGDLYVTGPIANGLTADIAIQGGAMGDGYGKNFLTGKDVYKIDHNIAVRSKVLWRPDPATEMRLILDYTDYRDSMNQQRIAPGSTIPAPYGPAYGGSPWDTDVDFPSYDDVATGGASLRIDHDFSGIQMASITAYRRTAMSFGVDADYTERRGRIFQQTQTDRQFSQELQLLSPKGDAFKWVLGAYYFNANSAYPDTFGTLTYVPGVAGFTGFNTTGAQKTDSISGFGQGTITILSGLNFTAGLRYTSEKRRLVDAMNINFLANGTQTIDLPTFPTSVRFNKLTWRFALDYQITNQALVYASYNRGFKSGGYNTSSLTLPAFAPEQLDAYEVGLKTTLFDRHVRLNGAGFYYDYTNVQVQRAINGATGIYNGGKATIYGFEAELQTQITSALGLNIGYQFTHGRYDAFPGALISTPNPTGGYNQTIGDASGNTTVLSPKSTLSATANYLVPLAQGDVNFNVSYYYNSGYFHEPDNLLREPAYSLVNASIKWTSENKRLSVSLWGNNLSNEAVANVRGINAVGGGRYVQRVSYAAPRTYGVTVGTKF
ncbi:TonB-dependent receptor [Rhizorhabdus dicambivorans]|uniref:TonB-dependent receptor n=1 Tax=Rhizorhabdus dicambivorans TaxID=1850238 RepID=A0A2A4FME7_9SPHN|nr:TonB-dependent receptor [Rhizorhabdus dicambivorans]ATE65730.1 TonB-dependent receptor [Rhizorhabdus dicambivorans]PCE39573.1 TonB-dependent receptor [Rhizorhabdus dicambivorans]